MTNFPKFSSAVRAQFDKMAKGYLFEVECDRDTLWDVYLSAFPEGTNPLFRERTEHDCSCCKSFIRGVAHIVGFVDGEIVTVWDVKDVPHPYDVVAQALADKVRELVVAAPLFTQMPKFGADVTREMLENGKVKEWRHFSITMPRAVVSDDAATYRSKAVSAAGVFKRGLEELTLDALLTVAGLIEEKVLYRGEEWLKRVKEFTAHKEAYSALNSATARANYVWMNYKDSCALLKNTSMGTLIEDVAKLDLESAVRKYEAMVAPANYKRSKSLITPMMVEKAVAKLGELGLDGAVKRRHARLSDVSVNDVLFVDNAAAPHMKDGLTDLLMGEVKRKPFDAKRAADIRVEDFVQNVLPNAKSLDVVLAHKNQSNFMTMTGPKEEDTGKLFAWDNDFAWSYDGDVTDSLKDRVKKAGGDVNAAFRVSLGWYNTDDLDLHCESPAEGHIYFGQKKGILDIDMNMSSPVRDPVENMRWQRMPKMGTYIFSVDNYRQREVIDYGFELEVEGGGRVWRFDYTKLVKGTMKAIKVEFANHEIVRVTPSKELAGGEGAGKGGEKWGVPLNTPVPVDSLMLSPNHWGENAKGHKHWFFILRDCTNPEKVRGIFNEYLRPELHEHRKVFEVLGAKTMVEPADEQLSGVGFTAAREDKVTVVVNGGVAYNVHF